MKKILLIMIACASFSCSHDGNKAINAASSKIIIEVEFPQDIKKRIVSLKSAPFEFAIRAPWVSNKAEIEGNIARWTIYSDTPLVVNLTPILGEGNNLNVYEPNDSVHINITSGQAVYSGRNTEKFKLKEALKAREKQLSTEGPQFPDIGSLLEYLTWNSFLDRQLAEFQKVYDLYQNMITPFVYDYIKAGNITKVEYNRLRKFGDLKSKAGELGLSSENLGMIFDTTTNNTYVKWLHTYTGRVVYDYYFYDFVRKSVQRKYNFDPSHDSLKTVKRKMIYVDFAMQTYNGCALQSCLAFMLTEEGLKEYTLKEPTPEIDTLLAFFYAQPGYPEYKQYVKEYEKRVRDRALLKNGKKESE